MKSADARDCEDKSVQQQQLYRYHSASVCEVLPLSNGLEFQNAMFGQLSFLRVL